MCIRTTESLTSHVTNAHGIIFTKIITRGRKMKKTIDVCDICKEDRKAISNCCVCGKDACKRCSKPYVLEDKVHSDFILGIVSRSTHNPEKYSYICKECKVKILGKIKEISKMEDLTKKKLFKELISKMTEILEPYVVANKI